MVGPRARLLQTPSKKVGVMKAIFYTTNAAVYHMYTHNLRQFAVSIMTTAENQNTSIISCRTLTLNSSRARVSNAHAGSVDNIMLTLLYIQVARRKE